MHDSAARQEFEQLLAGAIPVAFIIISKRVGPDVAADVIQDAAIDAWRAFHRFQSGGNFKGWLIRIAWNNMIDWSRRNKFGGKGRILSLEELPPEEMDELLLAHPQANPEELVVGTYTVLDDVVEELKSLDPRQRQALYLYYFLDCSYEEIAEIVGAPINTVRTRLHRAKNHLRQRLLPKNQEVS